MRAVAVEHKAVSVGFCGSANAVVVAVFHLARQTAHRVKQFQLVQCGGGVREDSHLLAREIHRGSNGHVDASVAEFTRRSRRHQVPTERSTGAAAIHAEGARAVIVRFAAPIAFRRVAYRVAQAAEDRHDDAEVKAADFQVHKGLRLRLCEFVLSGDNEIKWHG